MKAQVLGAGLPTPRISASAGLGWGLGIHISNTLPGDADAAIRGHTLRITGLDMSRLQSA